MKAIIQYFDKQRLLILLVVMVFYGNTLKNGYSLDDSIVTEKGNVTTKGISAIPKIITSFYIEQSEDFQFDYRPMVKISFAIEHELFGVSATTSHFFNLLLYLIGLYLLLSVLRRLLSEYPKDIAFYCVVLFAVMPIHTEVVASLKNRDILLCFIFCMLGLKHLILFLESNFKKWVSVFVSLVSFYLSFMCKFDVLPYLAIIPILFYTKHPQHIKWILVLCVVFISTYYFYKFTKTGLLGKGNTQRVYHYFENPLYFEKGIANRITATFNSLGFYINQSLFPFKMCCYYGTDTIPVLKLNYHGYLGIICAPLLVFGLIQTYVKKNYLLFAGLVIFCSSVSMYLNFVKPAVGIVADRFAFFSSLGIAIIIIALTFQFFGLGKKPTNSIKLISLIVLMVFATLTIKRNSEWNNVHTLIDADTNKYPNNAYLNYKKGMDVVKTTLANGSILSMDQKKIKLTEARTYLEKSIATEPNYANSRNYLSYVLVYLLNDFSAAIPHINHSLAYKETTELYYYKAICMRETKQKDSSEFYLLKCISMDNTYYNAYGLLMYDYNLNKEFQKSIDLFNGAIKKGIEAVEIYNGLGKTYWEMKNNAESNKYYRKALEIDGSNQEAAAMVKRTSTPT